MRPRRHLFTPAALLLLAWGVFAMGAVYTWAHAPLLVFGLAVSALGFLAARATTSIKDGLRASLPLTLSLALLLTGAIVQVLPLPAAVVTSLSPARDDVDFQALHALKTLREEDAARPATPPRTLSVAPSRTKLGIALLAAFALLLAGAASGFAAVRPTMFVRGVIVIGVFAAFAALAQLTLRGEDRYLVYGLFHPLNAFQPSAPFMNRNHTAGFLVMTMALAMGYFASSVATGWRRVKPEWRERVLWFASREGSEAVLVAFAIMVMTTGIIATASRSGALTLVLSTLAFGLIVVRRQWPSRGVKAIVLTGAVAAVIGAAGFAGLDEIVRRFAVVTVDDPAGRAAIWDTAIRQAQDFPLTGTGLNTFGVASLEYERPEDRVRAAVEAHNDYLQLASEGGLLLGLPALAAIVSLVVLVRRRFRERRDDLRLYWIRVGAVIAMIAIALQAAVEFTLQMPGAATLFVLLAAIAVHRPSGGTPTKAATS